MKKFFTLIAAALMAVGANAQTLTFDELGEKEAGAVNEVTLGDSKFKAVFVGGSKAKIASKSLTFKVSAEAEAENFKYQWCPGGGITKLTGERSVTITVNKGGTLTVYARTASSDDRDFTVQQNGETILTATAFNAAKFDETYFQAYAVEVAAGTVNILADAAINISGLKFEADPNQEDPVETTNVASWNQGTIDGGTWSVEGTAVMEGYTGKIHSNKDQVTCATFPNSAWAKATEDATENSFLNYLKVEGDFKAGDIVTIQPFTAMSTADFTGKSKYANIVLYDAAGEVLANMTGSAAGALTVTDGHEEAAEPKTFSFELGNDYTALCFGRQGNSRINLIKVEIGRPVSAGISNVAAATMTTGKWYNLQGQVVAAPTKGLFIKDGKKVIVK